LLLDKDAGFDAEFVLVSSAPIFRDHLPDFGIDALDVGVPSNDLDPIP
jgi:hypothetical protein